jgi:hypothetical protein
MMSARRLISVWLAAAAWLAAPPAQAQEILLDEPVRAGELTLFRSLGDESTYFYVLDKPRLATDASGSPQFSFLRYVQNVRGGADPLEGEGGGILHALVTLSVSAEQLRDAERALQRLRPGARIQGPVVFKAGKFALVSSFTDASGNLTTRVVGLGNAPLLDGEKAAVSMQLTKLGSKLLWESFHSPTPDISFSFEMDLQGYRAPKRAVIEADFDQIYEHQGFAAGLASTYLAAEIKGAFDDLRRTGAIKVEQVGEDERLGQLVTTAYNKIAEIMFQPVQGTGTPDLAGLAGAAGVGGGGGGGTSVLDRAGTMLASARREASDENRAIRERNEARRRAEADAAGARDSADRLGAQATAAEQRADSLGRRAALGRARAERLREQAAAATSEDVRGSLTEAAEAAERSAATLDEQAGAAREEATALRAQVGPAESAAGRREAAVEEAEEEVAAPAFAIVAAYEMKRVRQRGTFRIDLNKYTSETLTLRFDENIGDLRSRLNDNAVFRQVNLDDPLYRQREIVAFVDGLSAGNFGEYVNFVDVQMRKVHAGGAQTLDEVRIDRNNFNREGNAFTLLYGWKNDDERNRQAWLNYEYKTLWSFFGGSQVEGPWQRADAGTINLVPPYQKRVVAVEADPARLAEAQVRSITVKIYYRLGEREMVRQVSLNPARNMLSVPVEFMLPAESFEYDYEVSWRLSGNRSVSSGRQTTSEAVLFVDELPGS